MSDPDPDYGKKARENYKAKNPQEEKDHPEIDRAYLDGEKQPDPVGLTQAEVGALRKKLAEKASRYQRPAGGYIGGDKHKGPEKRPPLTSGEIKLDPAKEDLDGGGIYLRPNKAAARTDKEICDSVYHWVEDTFWPKWAEPTGSGRNRLDRNWGKADAINKGEIDVGKRMPKDVKSGWYCVELAQFLAWLLRQLGYKVQYKNIVPSKATSKPPGAIEVHQQTAALDVWYAGAWHLYDPFESLSDDDGGLDAYVNATGDKATPYSDAYVYIWERGDYDHFTWDAPKDPVTEAYLDNHMKKEGWTRAKYVKKAAGASAKNMRAEIRIGLTAGDAQCGWFGGDVRESWIGARYRPYGRPEGAAMGSPGWEPATDETIDINLFTDATLPMTLAVTNVSDTASPFEIEMFLCQSDELRVSIERPRLSGTLAPGATQSFALTLRAERVGWPPPAPVTGVRGAVHENRIFLTWNDVPGAVRYRVYQRDREIETARDLRQARLVREVPLPCCELPWRGRRPLFVAVIAADRRRRVSPLDSEQGSSAVIMRPSPKRSSPKQSRRSAR